MASGAHPRRERKRKITTANTSAPETEPPASPPATSSETAAIGSLSLGGVATPRAQQEAVELIGSIEKRLSSLSAQKAETEKQQVSRIRNFQRQAQEALDSGDVEGAKTLATKARLLLDDLDR
jgi:ribosomal protein S20